MRWKEGLLFGGRGRQADAGDGHGGAGDGKEEERMQQGNTWEDGGNGLEPLSAGPMAEKGGARGRAGCSGRHILGPNLRSEWMRANAFGQLCLFGSPRWAVCSVCADAFGCGVVVCVGPVEMPYGHLQQGDIFCCPNQFI
jgi:hypothetical protein